MGRALNTLAGNPVLRMTAIFAAQAGVMAVLGVYDTELMPPLWRFLFWFVLMAAGGVAYTLIERPVSERWLKRSGLAVQIGVMSLIVSVPVTLGLMGLNTNLRFDRPISVWALQFLNVLVIAVLCIGSTVLARRLLAPDTKVSTEANGAPFMGRLPVKFRNAELYALSSEGHYVRAHTSRGETMILLRLSDAIREVQALDGVQTHRSWWVARAGVDRVERQGKQRRLVLKSGVQAPVARARVSRLKDAGLDR